MNVAPVSLGVVSSNNQPHFEAQFPKTDMVKLIKSAKMEERAAGVPKLYTLIEYLYAEIPGKVAKIINKGDYKVIKIDGRPVFKTDTAKSHFQVLKEFLVGEHSLDRIIRIPDRIFENRWFENRSVKENVVRDYVFVPEKPVYTPVITEEIKPYNITKEAYNVSKSRKKKVEISNIEILSKEKPYYTVGKTL